jgi:hypothetical protein
MSASYWLLRFMSGYFDIRPPICCGDFILVISSVGLLSAAEMFSRLHKVTVSLCLLRSFQEYLNVDLFLTANVIRGQQKYRLCLDYETRQF